jgi:hypothetical protein
VTTATHERAPARLDLERLVQPLAWGLAASVVMLIAGKLGGYSPFSVQTWARWDSRWYLSIADHGYTLGACSSAGGWCGSTGWFPAYPALIAALSAAGLSPESAGALISGAFGLGLLVLLRETFLRDLAPGRVAAGLAFAAFIPGAVYLHALFPLSMLGFFSILGMWQLARGRFALAGAALAVAAASYHLGVLLLPVAIAYAWAAPGAPSPARRLQRVALAGGIGALGPLLVLGAMRLQTGHWDAFFLLQQRYHHGFHAPWTTFGLALQPLAHGQPDLLDFASWLVVAATVAVGAVTLDVINRRRTAPPDEWLLLGATLVLFLFPLTQDDVGLYRTASTLLPAAPLVARLPTPIAATVCACAAVVALPIAVLYVRWQIV